MQIAKKTNKTSRTTVVERQSPGASAALIAMGLAPVIAPVLVLGYTYWKHRSLAQIEIATYIMLGAPVLVGVYLLSAVWRRVKQMAAVSEAVQVAAEGQVAATELFVAETATGPGKHWNTVVRSHLSGLVSEMGSAVVGGGENGALTEIVFESLTQAVVGVDRSGRVLLANAAASGYFGIALEELAGKNLSTLLESDAAQALSDVLQGRVQRRNSADIVRQSETSQSEEVLRVTVTPVRETDRMCAVVTIDDVTRQRLAEKSRHEFLAQATHELRTPLTNIKLYVEEAIDAGDSDPATRSEALNVISHESLRLERLVAELLDISELEAGARVMDRGDVRVEQLMEQLQADYGAMAESKSVELVFELPPKLPVLQGDRDKIAGALHNLVGNAIKYTPEGGTVTVHIDDEEGVLRFAVVDTGIGIKPEEQTQVYDKFFRSSDERVSTIEGTGLGLAFAMQVARMHGGELSLESELNRGSTFTMSLPKPKLAA